MSTELEIENFNYIDVCYFLSWDSLGVVRPGIKVPASSALGGPIIG